MTEFPNTLRKWRRARRFSQLDLAGEAGVSPRHISFLESGRSRPSPEMIGRLSDALTLPLDARNQMLTHAGFAARYLGRPWDDSSLAPIRAALSHMLKAHDPLPGLAVDQMWRVVQMNQGATRLYGMLDIGVGDSLLDLMVSDHLPQFIENWPAVAHHACQRLRAESAAQGGVAELDRVADQLADVPHPKSTSRSPVLPTVFVYGNLRLSLFATIAQFGTPEDIALDTLKIELFYPADDATGQALKAMSETK